MKTPNKSTSSNLANVENAHHEYPRTFSIPRSEQRRNLNIGQVVKLVFLLDAPGDDIPTAERMWVEVKEARGSQYIGILDNEPFHISNLKLGDAIEFGPEHVAALYRKPEDPQIPHGKTVIVSHRILTEDVWPQRLVRQQPMDETESGWWIFSGEETEAELSDNSKFSACRVDEIIQRFRILDSVLDEPVNSAWAWNNETLEYQPCQPA